MPKTNITSLADLEFYLEYILMRHPSPTSEFEEGYLEGLRYVLTILESMDV